MMLSFRRRLNELFIERIRPQVVIEGENEGELEDELEGWDGDGDEQGNEVLAQTDGDELEDEVLTQTSMNVA
jgi:hypothetical protein